MKGGEYMHLKTAIITASLLAGILALPFTASAQSVTPARGAGRRAANLSRISTLCTNAINQRVTSLNTANTRISGLIKLSSSQKQQYSGEVSSDISGLQGVQTQCTNDYNAGNIQSLRADYKSVFTQYRVYAEFLPQLHLLIASDTMGVTDTKLSDLATKLQSRIQSDGNPSNLTSLLSDMQTQVTNANNEYTTVQTQVTSLTPQSYDSNPTSTDSTLQGARGDIKTGASDLKTAFSDAKQIIQALESNNAPTPTP